MIEESIRCQNKDDKRKRSLIVLKVTTDTAQKSKFSIRDFFSKCDQIRSFLRIWPHLMKKSLMENFIFCAMDDKNLAPSPKWIFLQYIF